MLRKISEPFTSDQPQSGQYTYQHEVARRIAADEAAPSSLLGDAMRELAPAVIVPFVNPATPPKQRRERHPPFVALGVPIIGFDSEWVERDGHQTVLSAQFACLNGKRPWSRMVYTNAGNAIIGCSDRNKKRNQTFVIHW